MTKKYTRSFYDHSVGIIIGANCGMNLYEGGLNLANKMISSPPAATALSAVFGASAGLCGYFFASYGRAYLKNVGSADVNEEKTSTPAPKI